MLSGCCVRINKLFALAFGFRLATGTTGTFLLNILKNVDKVLKFGDSNKFKLDVVEFQGHTIILQWK